MPLLICSQCHNPTQLIARALAVLEARARRPGIVLNHHSVVADWFRLKLAGYEHEVFAAAWLDKQKRLVAFEELFHGTLDTTAVPAREVVKAALRHNAAAVLFAHNHPSGHCAPSGADLVLTRELQRALDLVGVHVLDHFVVSAIEPPQSVWSGPLTPSTTPRRKRRPTAAMKGVLPDIPAMPALDR